MTTPAHAAPASSGSKVGAWVLTLLGTLVGGGVSVVVSALVAFGFSEGSDGSPVLYVVLVVVAAVVWGLLLGLVDAVLLRTSIGGGIRFALPISVVVIGLVATAFYLYTA